MSKIKRLQRATALCVVMALAMTGCGKIAREDNVAQAIDNIDGEENNTGQILSDMLKVNEEKWIEKFEVQGDFSYSIKIGAAISLPDVDSMSIVTLNELEMDNVKKREIVEKVCEKGEIYSFDDTSMTKWYWKPLVETVRKNIEDMIEARKNNIGYVTSGDWGSEDESYLEERKQELAQLESLYESAPEYGYDVGDYSANNYIGMTENGRVVMYYYPEKNRFSWDAVVLSDYSKREDITDKSEMALYVENIGLGENLCSMSVEEAKNYAISYISKLGYTEYVVDDVRGLGWEVYSPDYERWTDGYVITLARKVNGTTVDYAYNISEEYDPDMGECIQLQFNDVGVIHCEISHPREMKEVITESTLLLSYEQVKNTIKTILLNKAKEYQKNIEAGGVLPFSEMELIYYAAKDKEQGIIVVVPAWRLTFKETSTVTYCNYPLIINAIDGSEVSQMQ